MPEAFNLCIQNGGKVTTKTLSGGRYQHICWLDGKSYAGEIKTKKMSSLTRNRKEK